MFFIRFTIIFIIFILNSSLTSYSADLEDLCKDGYAVILDTNISGTFNGCDYDQAYKLDNGMTFKCGGYDYDYAYHPDFYVLQHIKYGNLKFIIDDDEFDGKLYR